MWSRLNSHVWKRDEDEVKSAGMLLEEHRTTGGPLSGNYTVVEPIPIEEETGVTAIAFTLPEILRQWGGRIREIQLDSTCKFEQITTTPSINLSLDGLLGNTNGSRFEIFALLGETYGSGLPLRYLIIQLTTREHGVKERFISRFLNHITTQWNLRIIITLTDKDWSEINAFRATIPAAKHQLCFWHALRAIKKRLAKLRRAPAHYDVEAAHAEFHWIDKSFVPVKQSDDPVIFIFLM